MLRKTLLFFVDSLLLLASFCLAVLVRHPDAELLAQLMYFPVLLVIRTIAFGAFGLYQWSFRYAGVWEGLQLFKSIVVGSGFFAAYLFAFKTPFSTLVVVAEGIFTVFLMGAWRFFFRAIPYLGFPRAGKGARTLIVGAGDAGEAIAREFLRTGGEFYVPVGFVDDDPKKQGMRLHRWSVLGSTLDIPRVVEQEGVDVILLALPPLSGDKIRSIVSRCEETKKPIKILPQLDKLLQANGEGGSGQAPQIRDIKLEDLLTRAEIQPHPPLISQFLKGKRVLVTGAAGSIGAELVRQILPYQPASLVGVDRNENDLYMLFCEIRSQELAFRPVVADILNTERMESIFRDEKPEIVFHAAAFKHVPLMQIHPEEAIRNNVAGTQSMARLAEKFSVERFVNISTDKAVNPTSVMGATKRVGELLLQEISPKSSTKFCTVRFGNVIGSKGSVVQIFKEQIRRGEAITITHPDMKRYFMTVKEGVCLVLEAGAVSSGGEVFMLKMGDEIRIVDLARNLIALHRLVPEKDVPIRFVGIRPGEKLSEELLANEEYYLPTAREHLLLVKVPTPMPGTEKSVLEIIPRLGRQEVDVYEWLSQLVPEARLEAPEEGPTIVPQSRGAQAAPSPVEVSTPRSSPRS